MPRKRALRAIERREVTRRHVLYPAYLLFMRRRFRCRLVEIGVNGVCVTGAPSLKAGTPVMIEALLLGRRAGVVAHRTGQKLGIALFGAPLRDHGQQTESMEDEG